ncbi:MAG: hypothetical protein DYG89_05960 [Caldilinea sp. CFX5]|nr:hypothetical protein [Caldilinea sp. CFX5]
MSRSSSIDIQYYADGVTANKVLTLLLSAGWNLNDFGRISFLPLGDNGRFDWLSLPYDDDGVKHVLSVLQTKEQANEMLGVILQWKDSESGGIALLRSDQSISFTISINRRTLPNLGEITDIQWYLTNLLTPLLEHNIVIESIEWSEHI